MKKLSGVLHSHDYTTTLLCHDKSNPRGSVVTNDYIARIMIMTKTVTWVISYRYNSDPYLARVNVDDAQKKSIKLPEIVIKDTCYT